MGEGRICMHNSMWGLLVRESSVALPVSSGEGEMYNQCVRLFRRLLFAMFLISQIMYERNVGWKADHITFRT
jgi:hypothetical protein